MKVSRKLNKEKEILPVRGSERIEILCVRKLQYEDNPGQVE